MAQRFEWWKDRKLVCVLVLMIVWLVVIAGSVYETSKHDNQYKGNVEFPAAHNLQNPGKQAQAESSPKKKKKDDSIHQLILNYYSTTTGP